MIHHLIIACQILHLECSNMQYRKPISIHQLPKKHIIYIYIYHYISVVSTPLKNIRQLGLLFPIYGKIKNVPNHQPDMNNIHIMVILIL